MSERVRKVVEEVGGYAAKHPVIFVALWFAGMALYYAHKWVTFKAGGGL